MGKHKRTLQFFTSKKMNCHIITAPPSIIEKIENFGKSQKKLTTDTVKISC